MVLEHVQYEISVKGTQLAKHPNSLHMFKYPWLIFLIVRLLGDAIPGYERHPAVGMMKNRKILD